MMQSANHGTTEQSADYQPRRAPQHEHRRVRGLDLRLTWWGVRTPSRPGPASPNPASFEPPHAVLLHGWQDVAATFQFMVDAFERDWRLVGLDWRGFGKSEVPQDGYWFPDYLADLDALLAELSPQEPVRLIGHSMGGNLASLYAGLRPGRVRSVVNLEGFGMPRTEADDAPGRMRMWLEQLKSMPSTKTYESVAQLASIVAQRYPRFTAAQSNYIARAWSESAGEGGIRLLGDPRHRRDSPTRYHRDDAEAIWREIAAPMLLLLARHSVYLPRLGLEGEDAALRATFKTAEIVHIENAGHMLHIEQAATVASLVENFLRAH